MTIEAKLCRVYYNKSGNPAKAWSVDTGKGTAEIIVGNVVLSEISASTELVDGDVLVDEARAYVGLSDVVITVENNQAIITRRVPASPTPNAELASDKCQCGHLLLAHYFGRGVCNSCQCPTFRLFEGSGL